MSYVTAIVLAAGEGLRFSRHNHFTYASRDPDSYCKAIGSGKSKISKPLIEINSKPIIIYSLNTLNEHPGIKDIILVVNPKNLKSIIGKVRQYRIGKIKDVVLGGRLRQDSVINGLKALNPQTDLVLIHDGVRPFIDKDTVSSALKAAGNYGGAVVGVPAKATIKSVKVSKCQSVKEEFIIEKTLNRENLWEIQTPQVFKKELILEAYKKFGGREVTDDAALVEKLGVKVRLIKGSYFNLKITTPEDLIIAEAILKTRKIGFS